MLGEPIGESTGQLAGSRVLPLSPGGEIRMESSFNGSGRLLGIDMTDVGTFVQTMRADGVLFVEQGNTVITGAGGEVAFFTGFALGKPTGSGSSAHFASCGYIRTNAPNWKRLNEVAIVCEFEIDGQQGFKVRVWEWK